MRPRDGEHVNPFEGAIASSADARVPDARELDSTDMVGCQIVRNHDRFSPLVDCCQSGVDCVECCGEAVRIDDRERGQSAIECSVLRALNQPVVAVIAHGNNSNHIWVLQLDPA